MWGLRLLLCPWVRMPSGAEGVRWLRAEAPLVTRKETVSKIEI